MLPSSSVLKRERDHAPSPPGPFDFPPVFQTPASHTQAVFIRFGTSPFFPPDLDFFPSQEWTSMLVRKSVLPLPDLVITESLLVNLAKSTPNFPRSDASLHVIPSIELFSNVLGAGFQSDRPPPFLLVTSPQLKSYVSCIGPPFSLIYLPSHALDPVSAGSSFRQTFGAYNRFGKRNSFEFVLADLARYAYPPTPRKAPQHSIKRDRYRCSPSPNRSVLFFPPRRSRSTFSVGGREAEISPRRTRPELKFRRVPGPYCR